MGRGGVLSSRSDRSWALYDIMPGLLRGATFRSVRRGDSTMLFFFFLRGRVSRVGAVRFAAFGAFVAGSGNVVIALSSSCVHVSQYY